MRIRTVYAFMNRLQPTCTPQEGARPLGVEVSSTVVAKLVGTRMVDCLPSHQGSGTVNAASTSSRWSCVDNSAS